MLRSLLRPSCGSGSRRRVAYPGVISLLIAALAAGGMPVSPVRAADVIIDSAVGAPQAGQGGQFFVTTNGTISGGGNGIEAGTDGTSITTLTVEGSVNVTGYALNVADGAMMNGVINDGVMSGDRVIQTYDSTQMGMILNSGTMSAAGYGVLLYGTSTGFGNIGVLTATNNDAVYLIGPTSYVGNDGTITAGGLGVYVHNQLSGGENSGTIQSGNHGVYVNGGAIVGQLLNSGTITSDAYGVQNSGTIITGANTGLISGVRGLQADPGSSFTMLTNSGTVRGSDYGMVLYSTIGSLENLAGGLIEATTHTDGIYHEGTTTTFSNDGVIVGMRNGVLNTGAGTLSAITNSGTITGNGSEAAGLRLNAATTTTSLTNSGVINGAWGISQNAGTITTLTNSGTLHGTGGQGDGVYVNNGATIGSLVNQAGGRIEGSNTAVQSESTGAIGSIDNAGTITGWWGIYSPGSLDTFVNRSTGVVQSNGFEAFATGKPMTSFTNEVGGTISASGYSAVVFGGDVTTVNNAGTISGNSVYTGLQVYAGTVGTLTNTGTITGGYAIENYGAITTLNNSGSVVGAGFGIYSTGSLGELTNSGTVQGSTPGMMLSGTTGSVSNLAGGRIASTFDDGIRVLGTVTSLSNAGTIAGGTGSDDSGVELRTLASVGTLTNTGTISGLYGISTNNVSTIGSIVNSGTIQGIANGIYNNANQITSLVNQAGGLIEGTNNAGIDGAGFGTIDNAGTIAGSYGIYHSQGAAIDAFINRSTGVVRATDSGYGFYSSRAVGSFTNEAGGLIESVNYEGVYLNGNGVGTFTNAGTIRSLAVDDYAGLYVGDSITTLTNSGTISGSYGIHKDDAISTLTNTATGLLQGTDSGLYIGNSEDMAVINYGRITGGQRGIYAYYDFGPFTNKSGGVVSGTTGAGILIEDDARAGVTTITNEAGGLITSASGAGVRVNANPRFYRPGTVVNAGTIEGATGGVRVDEGGLTKLTNTGTIAHTGAGTGPAVFVGVNGVLGDATGAGGVALSSTGAGALLDGTIVNQGTIHYGFEIANQDVTVSADGGTGTFTNGLLDVADGNLTFTGGGTTTLAADVWVNSGTGTVFNEAVLAVLDSRWIMGNFTQTSAGTTSSIITDPTTFGSLSISGAAAFAGMLDLDLTGGFALAAGQTFNLFSFDSYGGAFSGLSVDGVSLASAGANTWLYNGLVVQENWSANGMSVSVAAVPEPSTFALGAAGLVCAAWLRHRRRAAARKAA